LSVSCCTVTNGFTSCSDVAFWICCVITLSSLSFSDDDDDDDEDDTEALMAELERIKKERAEEKLRQVTSFLLFDYLFLLNEEERARRTSIR